MYLDEYLEEYLQNARGYREHEALLESSPSPWASARTAYRASWLSSEDLVI